MITIISGTNRIGSKSKQVAQYYQTVLQELNVPHQLLSLENLDICTRNDTLKNIEQEILIPSNKFIFIIPEYNGSYPGILKVLMDNSDISKVWYYKKALLTGIADGRAGNLRGLDHLTNVLNYLKINVYFQKLPISRIQTEMDPEGNWLNEFTPQLIRDQISGFLDF